MLKFAIVAAGFCALTAIAPASAQHAADQCRATAGHVKVFDGRDGRDISAQPAPAAAAADYYLKIEGVAGESRASAREHGSRAAVGRRMKGGVRVAIGDVNGDGATSAARAQCANNLKQIGLANH